jgi:hypothetical protein
VPSADRRIQGVRDVIPIRAAVAELIENDATRISETALREAEWVLRSRHRYSSTQVMALFGYLAGLASVISEDEDSVRSAMAAAATGIDLADAMCSSVARRERTLLCSASRCAVRCCASRACTLAGCADGSHVPVRR